jgi:hypothetical protein
MLGNKPMLNQFWQMITMDFMEGIPHFDRFSRILVVVSKVSCYAHFI